MFCRNLLCCYAKKFVNFFLGRSLISRQVAEFGRRLGYDLTQSRWACNECAGSFASENCDIIAERKLTQTGAATLLGIDQPKISALMRGKLDGFSLDRLFRFLNAVGRDVEIVIRPAKEVGDADTRVVPA